MRRGPWKSNDKRRARINARRHVLNTMNYEGKNADVVGAPDPRIVGPAAEVFNPGEQSDQIFPKL